MSQVTQKNNCIPLKALTISCLVVLFLFLWQGNKGFSLWDEGFLWYGVQRVLLGEIPIRDFMAYDPGRYYWSAALLGIIGNSSIMSLRAAVAIFQAIGLYVGLFLIAQSGKNERTNSTIFLLISAAILAVWMFPRHKIFDISLSILLIGTLTFLIKNPIPRRYFVAGAGVGLVAVFGRNHGIYGAAGSLGVIAWLTINSDSGCGFLKGLMLWSVGVVIGFLPIIFMALLVPGFASAFWESICLLIQQSATNLPLPVPWPWVFSFSAIPVSDALRGVLIGLFFIGTLVFGGVAITWVVYRRLIGRPVRPALAASAFLALPYAHFAFSRADVGHLAQGIFPLLVGCLVVLAATETRIKWSLAATLCAASFWVMHVSHPGWQCLANQCVDVKISANTLQIDRGTASDITLLRELRDQYAPSDQTFIATPLWPGAYALLESKSPMWEIYALIPRSNSFEKKEIERIRAAKPSFAFIFDFPLDGRDELRFKNTHPLTHHYILENFELTSNSQNPRYQIYKSRDIEQ